MEDLTCSNETMMPLKAPSNCTNMSVCEKEETNINMYVPMSMMVTGMAGNLAALLVLYTLSKDIQRTVYFPLLSGLAWADLIGQALTSPIPILVYSQKIKLGGYLCMFNGFIMVFFGLLTPLLVCVLSLERMLSLKFTYFYHRVVTIRRARLTVMFCCLAVFLFCCLPFLKFGAYSIQFPCTWCFLKFHRKKDSHLSAYAILFGFINLVLIAAMVIFNLVVVITLLHMRRQRRVNTSPSSSIKRILPPTPAPSVLAKIKIEMEIKMVWFLCCITTFFLICWVPLNVHILESQLTNKTQSKKDLLSVRLASINQIIDPWLYILLRGNLFRKIFNYVKNIFPRKRKRSLKTKNEQYKHKPPLIKQNSRSNKIAYKEMCCLTSQTDDMAERVHIKSNDTSVQHKTIDCKDIESNICNENTDQHQNEISNSNSYQMSSYAQLGEGGSIPASMTYPCISNTTNGLRQLPDSIDSVSESKYSNRKSL
ncbi:prostaglandin E2 receptor EP4 subtype [Octopus bimaculoides]|uniref:G-protein coupled receptors family 1 profile domain-containing protein n=1 Tax=Octopus bimaculoides TaxID=37653 RepID=A0A0L8IBA6_OCTBM|nr:prostaglandin E2 receptor EP4 subtype [Octopus bimaculoides]|eukprot:XP_014779791.1 PREDICTED: prostaglandin E2 receptor EP4 subtype-like [Octopus bimaculoides]